CSTRKELHARPASGHAPQAPSTVIRTRRILAAAGRAAVGPGGSLLRSGRPPRACRSGGEAGMREEEDDETVISYQAARPGTPVLSSSGTQIGTLEHVLQVPELDVFDGIAIATHHGLRFIDADRVRQFRLTEIRCTISDEDAGQL